VTQILQWSTVFNCGTSPAVFAPAHSRPHPVVYISIHHCFAFHGGADQAALNAYSNRQPDKAEVPCTGLLVCRKLWSVTEHRTVDPRAKTSKPMAVQPGR
jgi:hypothetical protein